MKKIKIALLWHFHQPYYKKENEFILPWVRLHGVKDYKDLPELFLEFPNIKQTINIVPSMWVQINDYINNGTQDKIQILSKKSINEFSENDKTEFIRMFFLCNEENMIFPYPAYTALFNKSKNHSFDEFSAQEILDIQVWYNLTWIGRFSRTNPFIERLFNKGGNFTVQERNAVLDYHIEILSLIKTRLQMPETLGNLEISISPFYHPILPLLCDTDSLQESMPNAELPSVRFQYPEDANAQIHNANEYYKTLFNHYPMGMWPSEGSLSNDTLQIMINNNIKWAASDEMVLSNSMKSNYKQYYKYFPIKYKSSDKEISLFFRDHNLSDAIGFEYSNWQPEDAANDFIKRILDIKYNLTAELSEKCLDYAVIPIILDGENCWEFYKDNGIHFLRFLFSKLESNSEIETVLFKDICDTFNPEVPVLTNLQAGSWINGNFNIWAGHQDHRTAWSILSQTRNMVKDKRNEISTEKYTQIKELIYTAEGSDWFWWYGDSHWAENKFDFDVLFRYYLREIYSLLDLPIPQILQSPINQQSENKAFFQPTKQLNLNFNDNIFRSEEWNYAGRINSSSSMSAMHKSGELLKNIFVGNNANNLLLKFELSDITADNYVLDILIKVGTENIKIEIKNNNFSIDAIYSNNYSFHTSETNLILILNFKDVLHNDNYTLSVSSANNETEIKYPEVMFNIIKD